MAADKANEIAVNASGQVFIAGYTASTDFPGVSGSFDIFFGGGTDAFVSKLTSDGYALLYSGFLGGSSDEEAYAIAINSSVRLMLQGSPTAACSPPPLEPMTIYTMA